MDEEITPVEAEQEKSGSRTYIFLGIILVAALLLLCCCLTVVLAWFFGDFVLELLGIQV